MGVDVDIDSCFGWFKGGFKVSSGTFEWYRSRYGTDFDTSEKASPGLLQLWLLLLNAAFLWVSVNSKAMQHGVYWGR